MRTVKLRKSQFDNLLYPAIVSGPAKDVTELQLAVRVLQKLQNPSLAEKEVITQAQLDEAAKARVTLYPFFKMRQEQGTFHFEEDEHLFVLTRIKEHIHRVNMVAAIDMLDLIEALEQAPTWTVQQERPA